MDHARALKALGEKSRLKVVRILAAHGEVCACRLLDELAISQPTLSHHMAVLQDAGLVSCRREGRWCHYSLDRGHVQELAALLAGLAQDA